jgi:hypothetical protein
MRKKRERHHPGQGDGAEKKATSTSSMQYAAPAVNLESSRLWSTFRRYARNHRRIARLIAENAALLERLRQIQGVVE